MKTVILETDYSISLAGSYFVGTPILKEDWLFICLYCNQIAGILKPDNKFNQDLIIFSDESVPLIPVESVPPLA